MVGGYDFFKSEFNRAVQARRQPGSAFKAFVYLAALESGQTPASVVDDSPIEFPAGRNGKPWKPDNYDRKFRGPITYQQALEESVNVAAVKVLEKNGIRRTVDIARRLGVESPLGENLSIALGTSDLTLLEITSAYGALANQGTWMRPTAVRYVLDSQRKLLEENTPLSKQVVSPELAFVMTHMLRGTIERGTGVAARALGRPAAAKTRPPTLLERVVHRLHPQLVTGVWSATVLTASTDGPLAVAVPIWTTFMREALAGTPAEDFPIPERVVLVPIDLNTGGGCVRPVTMAFIAGTEPKETCGPARYAPGVSPPRFEPPLLPLPGAAPTAPALPPPSGTPPPQS
jgi:penicillin-binding protein 1A